MSDVKQDDGRKPFFSVTLADCEVEFFRAGGNGGQKVNKTSSACRVRHVPSGAVAECREGRSQSHNKATAFRKMAESSRFQAWLRIEVARREGTLREVEARVERAMEPRNLRVEVHDERGRWMPTDVKGGP